jgi:hypothetical protein
VLLGDLTRLIRSKNAGPFVLTIDVMFDEPAAFQHVVEQKIINPTVISKIFKTPEAQVRLFVVPEALAIKVSLPRATPSGDLNDGDIFGGQQYAPLVTLEVPFWEQAR